MIAFLRGTLVDALPTKVTLEVHGVGYEVLIPLSSFDRLPAVGQEVQLLTRLVIREDAHTLYGFMTAAERELFRLLVDTVTGIGPKIALSILSGMPPTAFRGAVASGDIRSLSQISGVGKKTAERIIVELRDKVGASAEWEASSATRATGPGEQSLQDAVLALIALGFKQPEAFEAARAAQAALGPQSHRGRRDSPVPEERRRMNPPRRPVGAVVVPHQPTFLQRCIARLVWLSAHALAATQRPTFHDPFNTLATIAQGPVIFAVWHNRLALSMLTHRSIVGHHQPARRLAALVSASRDGALLAAILETFHIQRCADPRVGAGPRRFSNSPPGPDAVSISPSRPTARAARATWPIPGSSPWPDSADFPSFRSASTCATSGSFPAGTASRSPFHSVLTNSSWVKSSGCPPRPDRPIEADQAELQKRLMAITRD
jgi:Holliday junction DNA helicase RuvA